MTEVEVDRAAYVAAARPAMTSSRDWAPGVHGPPVSQYLE